MTSFETQTCSRCGGSGHYSYNQMDGTRCFKCRGAKVCYTARGKAAVAYMNSLREFPVEQVQAGWLLYCDGFMGGKRGWFEITAVSSDGSGFYRDGVLIPYVMLSTAQGSHGICPGEKVKNAVPSKGYLEESRAKAIAYQETLSKTGKPLKRKVA